MHSYTTYRSNSMDCVRSSWVFNPAPSHPRELDFGPFRIRFGPFRLCLAPFRVRFGSVSGRFGVSGGVGVGSGRGASVREKNITTLGLAGFSSIFQMVLHGDPFTVVQVLWAP